MLCHLGESGGMPPQKIFRNRKIFHMQLYRIERDHVITWGVFAHYACRCLLLMHGRRNQQEIQNAINLSGCRNFLRWYSSDVSSIFRFWCRSVTSWSGGNTPFSYQSAKSAGSENTDLPIKWHCALAYGALSTTLPYIITQYGSTVYTVSLIFKTHIKYIVTCRINQSYTCRNMSRYIIATLQIISVQHPLVTWQSWWTPAE